MVLPTLAVKLAKTVGQAAEGMVLGCMLLCSEAQLIVCPAVKLAKAEVDRADRAARRREVDHDAAAGPGRQRAGGTAGPGGQ